MTCLITDLEMCVCLGSLHHMNCMLEHVIIVCAELASSKCRLEHSSSSSFVYIRNQVNIASYLFNRKSFVCMSVCVTMLIIILVNVACMHPPPHTSFSCTSPSSLVSSMSTFSTTTTLLFGVPGYVYRKENEMSFYVTFEL